MELIKSIESNPRWLQLKSENRFDLEVAKAVSTSLKEQCALAKNMDECWSNAKLLPSIQAEKKYSGDDTAILKMIRLLNPINMIAAGNNALANESGLKYAAEMIVNDESLKHWKLVEFSNMVHMAIKGEFGVIYNRVDIGVVYEWIGKYDKIRMEKIHIEREKARVEEEKNIQNIHPDVAKKIAESFAKCAKPVATKKRYTNPEELLADPDNVIMVQQFEYEYGELDDDQRKWYEDRGGLKYYKMNRAVQVMGMVVKNKN